MTARARKKKRPAATRRRPSPRRKAADLGRAESQELLHELQVHAEEISVQNEQLIRAQDELERARDRFADLYDFAPIGYMSLDVHGVIHDINLVGAVMLRKPRAFLLPVPLSSLIAPGDRAALRNFLKDAAAAAADAAAVDVTIKNGGPIVRLIGRRRSSEFDAPMLFTAMIDITEQRQLEQDRHDALVREQTRVLDLARENEQRMAAEERARSLMQRLVSVQEEERRRIALNLHDHLGQQLTALRLTIGTLRESKRPAASQLAAIESLVESLDRDIDALAWDLRPAPLDEHGLAAAFRSMLEQWSTLAGVESEFHTSGYEGTRLQNETESQLYRILQESLNNVSKHAAAQHVSVILERRGNEVRLTVEDDGRGFDTSRVSPSRGMGVGGMHERVSLIGGELQIESTLGKGTTVFVRVPVREPDRPPGD